MGFSRFVVKEGSDVIQNAAISNFLYILHWIQELGPQNILISASVKRQSFGSYPRMRLLWTLQRTLLGKSKSTPTNCLHTSRRNGFITLRYLYISCTEWFYFFSYFFFYTLQLRWDRWLRPAVLYHTGRAHSVRAQRRNVLFVTT